MLSIVRMICMCAVSTLFVVVAACAEQDQKTEVAKQPVEEGSAAQGAETSQQERLVRIARLDTAEENDEFTRNVGIMQAYVREVANLNSLLAQEEDMAAQYDIEVQIEELMLRINKDNQRMAEVYRYSLSRKYVRNIEKATVFLILTDEEVDNIAAEAVSKGEEAPKTLKSKLLSICTLHTPEAAQGFQRDVASMQAQRDVAIQLQTNVEAAENPEDRAYAQGRLDQVMGQIGVLNKAMVNTYGFSINRNYILQVDKSSLYIWATEDELANASETNQ